jgi:predicted deacylase
MYLGRIPAITVELGTGHMPDPAIIQASVAGTRNILRWAGMLNGEPGPIEGIKIVDLGYSVRRRPTPRVNQACVVVHLVEAGDVVNAGDRIATLCDAWGRPIEDGFLTVEQDGFVIGRQHGIYYYPGDPVLCMAIRNEHPLVAPYPKDYFK